MNPTILFNELTSLGIPISGCDSSGRVDLLMSRNKVISIDNGDNTFGSQTLDEPSDEFIRATELIELIKAAHGKSLSSDECIELKDYVTELEWEAYCECRKTPIRSQRAARYAAECDSLYLKLIEDAAIANTTVDLTEWLQLKSTIRAELPYEDEVE